MKPKIVNSSSIKTYAYNADDYTLTVTFNNGNEYLYRNVMPNVMSQVFDSPRSVGKKFRQLIAFKYKYEQQ